MNCDRRYEENQSLLSLEACKQYYGASNDSANGTDADGEPISAQLLFIDIFATATDPFTPK